MAYINVELPMETGEVTNESLITRANGMQSYVEITPPSGITVNSFVSYDELLAGTVWLFGDTSFGIMTYPSNGNIMMRWYYNNQSLNDRQMTQGTSIHDVNSITFACVYDANQDVGYFMMYYIAKNRYNTTIYIIAKYNTTDFCRYAYNNPPVQYTWQSVPSISGKNGILQNLVQIKEEAINDGEPVSEATVLSFDSLGNINIPSVIDEQMPVDPSDVTSVTATYLIPALENGTYEGIKLLVKKGSIPTSEEDADKVVNLDEPTSILRIDSKSVGNLDEDSHYYFVVKLVDEIGTEATSDPKDIWTSHNEGWSFDYTGQIQTFVAPKTGVYQLETWGAQGGNATDGTLVARGGYGAYAVGEVFLVQGDTLYINVGGQNGYGGGGGYIPPQIEIPASVVTNWYASPTVDTNINFASDELKNSSGTVQYVNTDTCILIGDTNKNRLVNENNQIKYTNSNGSSISAEYIPIGSMQTIQNVAFTYKKTDNNDYNYFDLYLVKVASDGTIEDKVLVHRDRGTSAYNVWTDVSYDCDFEANYIVTVGVLGTWYIKDIVLAL